MLEPISALTKATAEIRKGNFDVSVGHTGRDELSDLSQSFNSMVNSIKNYRRNQNELTDKLAKTNEELKRKEKLKEIKRDIRVLSMTAFEVPGNLLDSMPNINEGDIIRKPIEEEHFINKIKIAVNLE